MSFGNPRDNASAYMPGKFQSDWKGLNQLKSHGFEILRYFAVRRPSA